METYLYLLYDNSRFCLFRRLLYCRECQSFFTVSVCRKKKVVDSHEEGKRCIRTSIATSKQITKLIQPLSSKQPEYGPRCFSIAAPTLWNPLPDNVKSANTVLKFCPPFVDLDLILSNVFCFDAPLISGFLDILVPLKFFIVWY